ncbi:MAG: hypothetical protein D3922_06140 [Candidatus Electrothrix sp. AR1]|nr:hypothetical protein [Candidatus Electrothrix sp. AR1]
MAALLIGFLLFIVVVIFHFSLKRKYFSASVDKKEDFLSGINTLTVLLLVFYIIITLFVFLDGLRCPAVWGWNNLILFFTCPGLLVQLSLLVYSLSKKKLPSRFFFIRIMLIIIGIVLAVLVIKTSEHIAMQRFAAATEPLVQYVKKSMPAPCEPVYTYLLTNRPDTYFNMSDIYYNDHEFLLLYPGGSIDIDGSTVYFHSKHSQWEIIHNDDSRKPDIYLIGDKLEKCETTWGHP